MKTKKKNIGDVGIRLKPIKHNLLENYTKIMRKRKKKTKKLKRKRKKIESTKSIEIHEKKDPFLDILNKPDKKDKPEKDKTDKPDKDKSAKVEKDKVEKSKETEKEDKPEEPEFKKIKVQEGKRDISEKDPNIKSLSITVSTEPDKKKKGHSIKLE
jgi:hypothetical protein